MAAKIEKIILAERFEDPALNDLLQRLAQKLNEIIDRLNAIP